MSNINWTELYTKFSNLAKITSTTKSSSYDLQITFNLYNGIYIELGCYDIGDWPRHLLLGPFKTEEEAFIAAKNKILEAKAIVEADYDRGCYDD